MEKENTMGKSTDSALLVVSVRMGEDAAKIKFKTIEVGII